MGLAALPQRLIRALGALGVADGNHRTHKTAHACVHARASFVALYTLFKP